MAYPPKHAGDRPGSLANSESSADSKSEHESKDPTRVMSDPYQEDSFVTCDEIDLSSEPETSAIESPLRHLGKDATNASADAYSAFDVPPDNGLAGSQPEPSEASGPRGANETKQNTFLTKPDAAGAVRLFKDYELLEEIGRGGMGVVYKARQRSLNRLVALKMIIAGELATETAVQRFYREAQSAACLDHPNIVPIHEIGEHEGKHFFSMAYVEGTSLADRAKQKPFAAAEAVEIVKTVAEAVQYAHDRGIIHRDLKPANILLDRQGRPRITDFGLAKQIGEDSNLTASGNILGTPSYMSPEQATGDAMLIGPATDIYSLGGILFRLLTGKPPFQGKSLTETLVQVLHQAPIPARQVNADVPAALEAICLKCLQKDRLQRYRTAGELADALGEWLQSETGIASRSAKTIADAPVVESAVAKPSRRSAVWLGIAAACGVVAFASTLLLRNLSSIETATASADVEQNAVVPPAPSPTTSASIPGMPAGERRRDFGLSVEMIGSRPGPDGSRVLRAGQEVEFNIEVERDAYVGVWMIQADGTIVQIFPNRYETNHLVTAGVPTAVPSNENYSITATPATDTEYVRVIAATQRWNPLEGAPAGEGQFAMFQSPAELDGLDSHLRGLTFRPSQDVARQEAAENAKEVSEVVIPFTVK